MAQRAPFPASLKARPLSPKAQRAAGVGGQPTTPLTPRRKLSTPAAYSDTVPAEFQDKPKAGGDGSSLEPGLPRRDSSGSLSPRRGSKVFDRVRYLETFPERRRSFDLSDGQAWPGFRKSRSFDQADTRQARRRRTSFSDLLGAEADQRRSLFRQKAASFDERTPSRDIELKISEELGRIKRSAMASPLAKPVLRSPVLERAVNRELSARKARQTADEPAALRSAAQRKPLQRALATASPDHHEPETLGEDGGQAATNHVDRPPGGVWRRDPQPSPGSDQAPAPAHPPFVVVEMVKKVTLTPETRLPISAARHEVSGGLKPSSPLSKETLDGSDRVDVANLGSEAGARLGLAPLSPAGDPGQQGHPNPRSEEDQEHPKTESPTDGARPPGLEKSARKVSRTRSKKSRPVSPELESSDDSYISAGEDPLEPPLFEIAIADTVVTVGCGVLLKCIITGTPMPEVVWKKGGEVVRTSPGLVVKAEGERHTLFIPSAAPLHGGLYSVTASNEVGISSCCASVHVHTGPAPDTCPQVVPAGLYSPITSDDEYLSPLEDLGDLGYKGRQAQHSPDTRDPQTTETRQAVIDTHFKAPPTFEVSLSNQTVGEGEDVSLTVRVLGEPKPIIYWLRNREPVKADGRHCVLEGEDGGFQLNIAAAQRSDAGMYSCKAINEYGTRQCSCKMDVKGPRDVQTLTIVSGVRDVTVNAGESACFECEVRGPAELDVDWLADGKLVQPALLNCKMHFDGKRCKLQLQSVHEDDTGVYTCKLSTGAEEKLSSAQLTVLPSVAPLFTRKLQDLAVVEGRGAHLNVKVSGTPPPTLTWTHYGEKVIESEDVRILKDNGLHSLLILHAVSENEGEYSAIAQNPHGDAFCSAELYVEEPRPVISSPMAKLEKMPSIPEEPEIPENEMERFTMPDFLKAIQNVEVTEGKDTVLECQVTGLPYPSISWYHNGQKLLSTEERRMTQYKDIHRLVIRCVDHSHAGVYKTVIANKVGKATSYAHIYVSDVVPDPPAGPAAVVGVTGRTVTLRWTRPKKLDPSIDPSTLTYVIQSQVLGTPQWHILKTNVKETTCTIQSLNKGIQYLFRIQSATPKSCSKPCPVSEPIKLLDRGPYLEEAPCIIDKPDVVYAVENQSVCITCTLNYVQADVTWAREGVLLTHWPRQCELTMPDDDQHSLCLRRVGRMDVGDLLLTAANTHGVDTAHILLQLAEAPRFESIMEDLVVRPEDNARLGVVVEGRPLPVIHWYKDDEELLESSHLSFVYEDSECSLVILNTAPADSGVYTCTARNLAGDVSCKAELTVAKGKVESEDPMDDEDTILRKMRLLTDYYDIHHEIGRGAFSCVKQVTEKSSSVDYAAKLISFRATPRDQAVRELHILSQLDHERVVYFHDAFEKKNTLTIVMELCPQEELFDRLVKKPAVLETEVRYYVQQILEGIRYLHQNNILHLDIKPDNILLAHPGSDSVRICDFGNALELTPDTPQFSRLGTPEYVAPEIIAQTPVSTATDVWPVGVIAYIGLTGVSPFSGENDRATLLNVKNYDVAFEEKMFADLSRESKGFATSLLVEDKHRPSAEDCLHHVWFLSVDAVKGKMISTDPLKSLVSRRKWQRSLISYKSSMVVRTIPEVLADPSGPPSLGLPRQLRDPRLSSSSDSDEIDELPLLPMPTPPEFRTSRLPLHHLRGQAVAEAQAQAQSQAQEEQGVRTDDQGPTQAPSECGTETEMGPQAAPRHGPKAPARKRPPEAGPSDSSDEEAPQAGRGPSSEAADWPPAQAHSSASRRRGEFRRGSSADSALALLGTGESLGLEAGAGAQLSPAGGRLKKSVSMELPRRSPSPSPRRPEEGSGGRRRAGPASEDYSLKLELLRQRLLRGGSVDNKMSGLRGPLLERLGLPDGEPQHLGPLPLERQALRPPRPDKQSRLARAASSDSTPTQEEPERRALRKTASFSQAEPPTLHRRLGAPLEIPLQPAGPRAPSPELQFPLKESPSLSALTDPHSRPVTPVRAGRPQEARPLTPHIHVVPAPEEADGPCTKIMIGRTAVVTHSNLTADPKPEPPSIPARTDPILELTRPKPILGQPRPDPTLDLTRPKPMLGQAKSQPTADQARLKTTLELAGSDPTLDLTRPKPMLGQPRPEPTSGQTKPQRTLDLSRPQLTVELTRPKPTAGQARPQPIVELMRPKPILGQATPDPTLDLTRPKAMLGQAKPQPTVDQARLKTTLEQARPDPTLVLTKPQLTVDQAGPQPTLVQTGLEQPSPILADGSLTPPATEGTRIEDSDSRPVHVQAEHPGSLPLPEGRSPATVHQIGPVPPCEPAAITPPPGFRSTDQEEEKEGVQARLGPEAWESGAQVPPVKEKASSVAQCLNIDNMESEEVFEARFKRSKESSLSRSLKQLIRPRSEEKMEQASRPGDLHYRPGGTGQPLQLPKAQDATATNHQQAASRSRSEQNIPEASKDQGFMRKLSLRLKGGPADEGKEEGEGGARKHSWSLGRGGPRGEEEEEAGGTSKKKGPKSSPGLTVRRKIESTISGISMRFGRSQSEERVQEAPAGQSAGPTQREAKESKRPFLSLLRRSTSEAGSLKRVGIPQNQLATQTRSTPSTESLQSDTSLPTKQERGSVQGERKSRWDRWGFSRMKRDKAISQPNISLAVAAEDSGTPYHRSASDFPPVFHVKLKDQLLLEGEPLTLCSLPAGSPTPTVTWIKDDCPVASDERVKVVACADGRQLVTLMKTTRADVGVYVCTAANPLGTASSTCSVSLARLPGPPGAPEIPQKYKNTALVLWKAADTPGPCTYTLEYQREGDGRWTVLGSGITDCFFNATELMEGSLSFRLACRNKAGLGPYSRNSGPILIEGNPPAQRESEPSPPATISPVPVYAAKGMSVAISPPAPTLTPPAPSHSSSSSFPTAVTTVPAKPGVSPAPAPKGGPVPAKPGFSLAPAPMGGPVLAKPSLCPAPAPKGGPCPSPSLSPARPGPSVTPSRLSPTAKLPDGSGTGLRHGIPQKPYTFMEEKARGRFGVVRECKENSTGKVFMAKIVHYEGDNKQAVLQEYEVLKALHHDKVMCLHEAYVTPRYLVLISENCRGKEILYSLIDRFRYSEDDVVCYVQQMLQGLEYLHGRHIVHLDVKPDNVMVTFLNVVKLVDFGSAHFYNPTVPRSLAQRAGTHEYMSPEMMTGDPIGPPADIWGLGVLTYIMLSGRSPFLAPDPDETETRIKSAHFDLTKCYPNASQNAAHFIKRVLCMFPASRPTVRECVANPWLQDNYLMKLRRQTLTFTTTRLKEFLVHHQRRRSDTLTRHRVLLRTYSATPPAPSPPPTQ